ncbi:MAG: hypothetical protein JRN37_09905 [Nitrososphaerota archaeon]|jgi:peptidoglycan hydrolase CwlO-like protein|nr:hypothetical protein [Nitrososphaerota archaeon]MDG7039443.1 hypothetical protein [Nitrososphaerota archaeon]
MSDELSRLKKENQELKDQIRAKDQKIEDIRAKIRHMHTFEINYYGAGVVESDKEAGDQ